MRSVRAMITTVALGALLAGCALYQPPVPGGWATYGEMSAYYRRHAVEWDGRCRAPYLDGVLESEVVRETPDELALAVSYHWRDRIGDETGSDEFPTSGTDRCKGIDERTFTFAKLDDDRLEVVAMDGLKRGDRVPALFH
ncbi:MAG TPA: hypothetical protein VFZ01_14505 [Geminicoccaceae bacterium]